MINNNIKKIAWFTLPIITIGIIIFAGTVFSSEPEWHMVNVNQRNQGDAHLLIDNGINSMIDVGDFYQGQTHLIPYLQSKGIKTIHHLFVSHPHTDHYGGIDALVNANIKIKNIYFNLPDNLIDDFNFKRVEFLTTLDNAKNKGAVLKNISRGFSVKLDKTQFFVIHAQKEKQVNGKSIDTNDYSLIIQWDANQFRSIFTGDLNLTLGNVLAMKDYVAADILKIPHHGVTGIAPNAFFDAVNPSLSMFPSTQVLWNHPRGLQARQWATTHNSKSYCNNGLNGDVVLNFGDKINISVARETPSCKNGRLNIQPKEKVKLRVNIPIISHLINLLL